MADPIELELGEIPLGPRARQLAAQRARIARQRRMRPNGLAPDDTVGAPGLSNPDGRSAIDVRAQTEEQLRNLANDVTRAAGEGLAQPSSPAAPQALQQPDEEIGAPLPPHLAPLNPAQLGRVQALPVSGMHEDDASNEEAIVGAAAREMGTPVPPQTQLRAPMSGPAPESSMPLRAPGVMDDLAPPDEQMGEDAAAWGQVEDDLIGAPLDEPRPGAMQAMRQTPAQDPQDAFDLRQSQRMQRAQRGLAIGGAILSVLGGNGNMNPGAALAGVSRSFDANAPIERMNARHTAAAQAEQQEFERAMQERRAQLDERRIAQGEAATQQRAGYRDADILPDHQNAVNERELYNAAFSALPEHIRNAFPGFNPASPAVQQRLSRMGAAQVRRALELLDSQVQTRFPDEADWRNVARSGGGRDPRGTLPGLGSASPGRTIRRGDAGVTPEQLLQMDAQGVDEMQVQDAPALAQGARTPRGGAPRAQGRPQLGAVAGGGAQPPAGRPIADREPTEAEVQAMTPAERSTVGLARAYMRANPGTTWEEAVANLPNVSAADRSRLLMSHGSESAVEVPGWVRRANVDLEPRERIEIRGMNAAADRVDSAVERVTGLASRISPADLARNVFTIERDIQEVMNISREVQALMRDLQHMGVPNGPEMQMVKQQAPEADTPRELLRLAQAYEALRMQALASHASRMSSYGFVRAGRRPQGGAR